MKKKTLINIVLTVIAGAVLYYFMLPPLNLQSMLFYVYAAMLIAFYTVIYFASSFDPRQMQKMKFNSKKPMILVVIVLAIVVLNIFYSPLINASMYSKRITVREDGDFTADVSVVDLNSLPLLDKDSSSKLGDRVMGQMPELVSQFYVSDLYTQINYKNRVVRVTPLEYNGFFKY